MRFGVVKRRVEKTDGISYSGERKRTHRWVLQSGLPLPRQNKEKRFSENETKKPWKRLMR